LIDIAVPRDLDPGLNDLDNVYLYDIDDLRQVVEVNKAQRKQEADKAERIVAEETIKFDHWLANMDLGPTIAELRRKADEIRRAETAKTLAGLPDLGLEGQKALELMGNAMLNKLLHHPMLFLKEEGTPEEKRRNLLLVRKIFGLDQSGGNGNGG